MNRIPVSAKPAVGFYGIFMEPMADSGFGEYFCLCAARRTAVVLTLRHQCFCRFIGDYSVPARRLAIQNIIDTKTGVADIRSATIIDFIYATILLVFKEWSNIPMSTTWVF